ncbi:MAG: hypothetical protein PHH44_08755 [bacterium]|nr:hypothetical protein [bacterium]
MLKIKYQNNKKKLKNRAGKIFAFWLLIDFSSLLGCAGPGTQVIVPVTTERIEYEVLLNTEEAWRAVMRFSAKNSYRLVNLDSDKGIMEISGGDAYACEYNNYGFHYTFLFVGLEKGTKIVIEGSFHNSEGKEMTVQESMEKIRKKNEYRLLAALKKYFEAELNHGSARTKSS